MAEAKFTDKYVSEESIKLRLLAAPNTKEEQQRKKHKSGSENIMLDEDTTPVECSCEQSDHDFKSEEELDGHVKLRHQDSERNKDSLPGSAVFLCTRSKKSYKKRNGNICDQCGLKFRTSEILSSHLKEQHPDEPDSADEKSLAKKPHSPRSNKVYKRKYPIVCEQCGLKFKSDEILDIHVKAHHPDTGEQESFSDSDEKTDTKIPSFQPIHPVHHIFINEAKNLVEYLKTHVESKRKIIENEKPAKPFICHFCNKAFSQKNNLDRHITSHTEEKLFRCNSCNKGFNQKSNLDRHTKRHTGEKPFVCSFCVKAFAQKSNLDRHIRTHTGEKQYTCTICGEAFAQKSNLDRHVRTHTGEKLFCCQICNENFAQKCNLERHHLRMHTGLKQFSCSFCSKDFLQKRFLNKHIREEHGEEEPYYSMLNQIEIQMDDKCDDK